MRNPIRNQVPTVLSGFFTVIGKIEDGMLEARIHTVAKRIP